MLKPSYTVENEIKLRYRSLASLIANEAHGLIPSYSVCWILSHPERLRNVHTLKDLSHHFPPVTVTYGDLLEQYLAQWNLLKASFLAQGKEKNSPEVLACTVKIDLLRHLRKSLQEGNKVQAEDLATRPLAEEDKQKLAQLWLSLKAVSNLKTLSKQPFKPGSEMLSRQFRACFQVPLSPELEGAYAFDPRVQDAQYQGDFDDSDLASDVSYNVNNGIETKILDAADNTLPKHFESPLAFIERAFHDFDAKFKGERFQWTEKDQTRLLPQEFEQLSLDNQRQQLDKFLILYKRFDPDFTGHFGNIAQAREKLIPHLLGERHIMNSNAFQKACRLIRTYEGSFTDKDELKTLNDQIKSAYPGLTGQAFGTPGFLSSAEDEKTRHLHQLYSLQRIKTSFKKAVKDLVEEGLPDPLLNPQEFQKRFSSTLLQQLPSRALIPNLEPWMKTEYLRYAHQIYVSVKLQAQVKRAEASAIIADPLLKIENTLRGSYTWPEAQQQKAKAEEGVGQVLGFIKGEEGFENAYAKITETLSPALTAELNNLHLQVRQGNQDVIHGLADNAKEKLEAFRVGLDDSSEDQKYIKARAQLAINMLEKAERDAESQVNLLQNLVDPTAPQESPRSDRSTENPLSPSGSVNASAPVGDDLIKDAPAILLKQIYQALKQPERSTESKKEVKKNFERYQNLMGAIARYEAEMIILESLLQSEEKNLKEETESVRAQELTLKEAEQAFEESEQALEMQEEALKSKREQLEKALEKNPDSFSNPVPTGDDGASESAAVINAQQVEQEQNEEERKRAEELAQIEAQQARLAEEKRKLEEQRRQLAEQQENFEKAQQQLREREMQTLEKRTALQMEQHQAKRELFISKEVAAYHETPGMFSEERKEKLKLAWQQSKLLAYNPLFQLSPLNEENKLLDSKYPNDQSLYDQLAELEQALIFLRNHLSAPLAEAKTLQVGIDLSGNYGDLSDAAKAQIEEVSKLKARMLARLDAARLTTLNQMEYLLKEIEKVSSESGDSTELHAQLKIRQAYLEKLNAAQTAVMELMLDASEAPLESAALGVAITQLLAARDQVVLGDTVAADLESEVAELGKELSEVENDQAGRMKNSQLDAFARLLAEPQTTEEQLQKLKDEVTQQIEEAKQHLTASAIHELSLPEPGEKDKRTAKSINEQAQEERRKELALALEKKKLIEKEEKLRELDVKMMSAYQYFVKGLQRAINKNLLSLKEKQAYEDYICKVLKLENLSHGPQRTTANVDVEAYSQLIDSLASIGKIPSLLDSQVQRHLRSIKGADKYISVSTMSKTTFYVGQFTKDGLSRFDMAVKVSIDQLNRKLGLEGPQCITIAKKGFFSSSHKHKLVRADGSPVDIQTFSHFNKILKDNMEKDGLTSLASNMEASRAPQPVPGRAGPARDDRELQKPSAPPKDDPSITSP